MATNDDNNERDQCDCDKNKRPNYPVFTNPLDMERFFNQQLDEVVKSFGIFGSFFNGFPEFPSMHNPELFSNDQNTVDGENGSRDFMLKPSDPSQSSEIPSKPEPRLGIDSFKLDLGEDRNRKTDTDLDGSGIKTEDLDKLYRHPYERRPNEGAVPFFEHKGPGSLFGQIFGYSPQFPDTMLRPQVPNDDNSGGNWTTKSYSFSQSSSRSQFHLPDGSTEERSETTDNQGNKINKLKKTTRDGEWFCRTCITKPGGTEECQEETSPNYLASGNESNNTSIEGPQVFGGIFGPYGSFGDGQMHPNRGNDPRSEMLKKKEETDNSLFDKFFGGR